LFLLNSRETLERLLLVLIGAIAIGLSIASYWDPSFTSEEIKKLCPRYEV
jgi:hypothetical protein